MPKGLLDAPLVTGVPNWKEDFDITPNIRGLGGARVREVRYRMQIAISETCRYSEDSALTVIKDERLVGPI